jgi:hypothetical protein
MSGGGVFDRTTVISTRDIVCFLRFSGYHGLIAHSPAAMIGARACDQPG